MSPAATPPNVWTANYPGSASCYRWVRTSLGSFAGCGSAERSDDPVKYRKLDHLTGIFAMPTAAFPTLGATESGPASLGTHRRAGMIAFQPSLRVGGRGQAAEGRQP